MQDSILQRLQRLEDIEAIKQLKARYLCACDRKQVDIIRNCFIAGPAVIDYGPVGRFDHREGLIDAFNEQGNHDYIIDMHHGQNPQIVIIDEHHARATWQLYFHQLNHKNQTVTQLGAFYDDEYVKQDGEWRISRTVSTIGSQMITAL